MTTYSKAPALYKKHGYVNAIRSQWAANTNVYKPQDAGNKEVPEVAFVGSWSKPRQDMVSALVGAGIPVSFYGGKWPKGRVSDEEMIRFFSVSKINLGLNPSPGFWNANSLGRIGFRRSMDRIIPDFHIARNFKAFLHRNIPQIKARHFEIPACGGFLMTGPADDLGTYYKIGEEIILYNSTKDMIDKIRYYLAHETERKEIAKRGYERTVREHTYEMRFREIFKTIGIHGK